MQITVGLKVFDALASVLVVSVALLPLKCNVPFHIGDLCVSYGL